MSENPSPPRDRQLHRLVDGDLSPAERAAIAAVWDDALAAKVEGLGEVRALVRAAAEAELVREPLDVDAMWAQIAARVEGSQGEADKGVALGARVSAEPAVLSPPARPALQVLPGGNEASAREGARPAAARRGDDRAERVRTRRIGMAIVGGFAAAAAFGIVLLNPPAPREPSETVAVAEPTVATPALDRRAAEELRSTEVVSVDFGANVGTVFSVEGESGSRYAVVWLADEREVGVDDAPAEGTEL